MIESENSIEAYSSPDKLDELVKPISSTKWIILFSLFFTTLCIILFGFFGQVMSTVSGSGIIMKPGGIFDIVSYHSHPIRSLDLKTGDRIKQGQVIATLWDKDLEFRIQKLKNSVASLKSIRRPSSKQKKLLKQTLFDLALLNEQHKNITQIVSPYNGNVIEILKDKGEFIKKGEAIVRMDLSSKEPLEATVYLSPTSGSSIKKGMTVYISPSTYIKEKDGAILGKVSYVSMYPSSKKGIMRVIKNTAFVDKIIENFVPIEVRIRFDKGSGVNNNYKWTTKKSNGLPIYPGTMCEAIIIKDIYHPVSKLVPYFRKQISSN
ncbi:HlyD family efflux transporter periplasmic adaptor subunit [bacterium]|jgi:hypothetical protein|nr:HlyD family efflux transporter periplasmic adaptor subunit [bacterium]